MIELPPEASALLEKARRDHNPTADDAERIRQSLHVRLGIAAALAPSMLPTQAAASAAHVVGSTKGGTLLLGLKTKLLLAVVTLSGVASVPVMMRSTVTPRASSPAARCEPHCTGEARTQIAHVAPTPTPTVLVEPRPSAEPLPLDRKAERRARRHERRQERAANLQQRDARTSHAEARASPPSEPLPEPEPTRVAAAVSQAAPGATAAPTQQSASASASADLVAEADTRELEEPRAPPELTLIRGALTSLRDGAPQRALTLLGTHAAHYPEGAFASERRGLRIVALCASGRLDEGLRERVVFLRREGAAPVAERVRHACQEAPGK